MPKKRSTPGAETEAKKGPPQASSQPPTAAGPTSLVAQIAAQRERETIQRASDEGRARRPLAGLGPASRVEEVAQRVEQEAMDRGSDELRSQRRLGEELGLEPTPAP